MLKWAPFSSSSARHLLPTDMCIGTPAIQSGRPDPRCAQTHSRWYRWLYWSPMWSLYSRESGGNQHTKWCEGDICLPTEMRHPAYKPWLYNSFIHAEVPQITFNLSAMDPKVVLYSSSTAHTLKSRTDIGKIKHILDAKKIPYEEVCIQFKALNLHPIQFIPMSSQLPW